MFGHSRSSGASYQHVALAWVLHNESGAKKSMARSERVSFSYAELVSYSTVVARYVTGARGKKFILASSHRYSQSTDRHISNCVSEAHVPVFYVLNINWSTEEILRDLQARLHQLKQRAIDAWKKEWWGYAWEVRQRVSEIDKFCKVTGKRVPTPVLLTNPILEEIEAGRAEKRLAFYHPDIVRRRERSAARRAAMKALQIEVA